MTEIDLPLPAALRQAATLWRARGAHVARLVDLAGLPEGGARLVVDDGVHPLAEVLARELTIGEAGTILVPLADGVAGFAAVGVVHGRIGVDAIRLDGRGAPVLGSFESSRLVDPAGASAAAAQREDAIAFGALAREVLAAVGAMEHEARDAAIAALDRCELAEPGALTAFAERLLEIVRPEPVRIGMPAVAPAVQHHAAAARTPAPVRSAWRSGPIVAALRARFGAVRPKFWIPAAAAVVALVAAVVLVPGDAPTEADASLGGLETPAAAPRSAAEAVAAETGGTTAVRERAPEAVVGATGATAASTAPMAGEGSDGEAAGVAGTTPGATASDPVSAVLAMRGDAIAAAIIDDYGDVVLLALETADGEEDVLIERTDQGWRLRGTLPRE